MMWTTQPRSEISGHPAITAGKGEAVLFLHGVGLRAEAWLGQFNELSGHAHLVAPDMPGHGENNLKLSNASMSDYIEAAADVLRGIGSPATVVGHSMGSMLALALAERYPDHVRSVLALNAIFARDDDAASAVQTRAASLDGKTTIDPQTTLYRWFKNEESPERTACQLWLTRTDPDGYKSAYLAFAHSDIPRQSMLARLSCPAVFMTGGEEPNSTPEMSRKMAEIAPMGRAIVIDDAAHMLPMTHPSEVNNVIRGLLQ